MLLQKTKKSYPNGTVIKLNGELLEITAVTPHQDIKGAVYYTLSDGSEVRDCRLHPEAVYLKAAQSIIP